MTTAENNALNRIQWIYRSGLVNSDDLLISVLDSKTIPSAVKTGFSHIAKMHGSIATHNKFRHVL